jgi:beta-glucanase (GH16 family)
MKKIDCLFLLPAVVVLACATAATLPAQPCPNLVWADEFDGAALDTTKWEAMIGDGCDIGLCGWGNNELEYYKAENATVSNGTLKITAKEERVRNRQYTSARLRTLNKGEWFFGRFEARIRMTTGQGIWPAFWKLPTDEVFGGWPASGEIDVMENIGSQPATVHGTIHYGASPSTHQQSGASYALHSGAFADDFHEFALEKEPGVIRWFVDGVLYLTRTSADVAPANWPFDERFHFLLNVAVGGNFPGNPDATTVFPQVLEVDYVRVWDGNRPHLAGDRVVSHMESGVVYAVGNAASGSSFNWTVPAGATIVSGQGTSSITVDFGDTGGDVAVDVTSGCGNEQLAVDVEVEPPYAFDFTFENFDDPANVTLGVVTGTLAEVANPDPSGVNTSATSARYTRSSGEQFDVIVYGTTSIPDASEYITKQRRFVIDLYTAAPVGSELLLQLEDSSLATPTNYPTGRHSRYQVFTSTQNQWERIEFPLLDRPDPSTSDGAVDTIVLLFAPNTFTGDVYYYDNLDSYLAGGVPPPPPPPPASTMHVGAITVGTQSAGQGNKRGTATVTIVDNNGQPVDGAGVTGTFTGDFNETVAGTTGGGGTVTLATTGTKKGSVTFMFCVDDVTHSTLTYDPGSNVVTCASL